MSTSLPLHLSIGSGDPGGVYALRASAGGRRVQTELRLPEELVVRARRLLGPGSALRVADPERLGTYLGQVLFPEPVRALLLQTARTAAQSQVPVPIYLRLRALELAALPWEWLVLPASTPWCPALREDYPLLRVQGRAQSAAPLRVAGPLRVLAVASAGEAAQLGALEHALAPLVRMGLLTLETLAPDELTEVGATLARGRFHLLHCAAPVGWGRDGEPRLLLGETAGVSELLHLCGRAPHLRLVVLTGAAGQPGQIVPAASLLAAGLVDQGLPAALALGGPLTPEHSASFAQSCYQALGQGAPADLAVTRGRMALAEQGSGWGLAQIYLRPHGEQLFRTGRLHRHWLVPAAGATAAALGLALVAAQPWVRPHSTDLDQITPQVRIAVAISTPSPTHSVTITPSPTPTPSPTATPTPTAPPSPTVLPPVTRFAVYSSGDSETLEQIAARFGSDVQTLAQLNRVEPGPQRAGRALVVPVYRADSREPGQGGLLVARGNPGVARVALTFDIEIDARTLYDILAILRERNLHGTFFLTGRWTRAFPDAARAIVAEGHEVGNHSLTHPFFSRIGLDGAASEIEQTEQIVQQTTGVSTRPFFRFPYGNWTPQTLALVGREGFVAYHWSADEAAIPAWLERAHTNPAEASGAILLMHGRASTVQALPGWLDRMSALGLQPGSLSETLR